MITLYTWATPNGRKASVMLEECELPYTVHAVDIMSGDQFKPEYVAVSPNSKIPGIVVDTGPRCKPFALFESVGILLYLANMVGRLLQADERARYEALQWLMFQMSAVVPIFGQAHHFLRFAKQKVPYAIDRFKRKTERLYNVMNARLELSEYLAGEYSVADIATYPRAWRHEVHETDMSAYPAVRRWFDAISARPALRRGMAVPGV